MAVTAESLEEVRKTKDPLVEAWDSIPGFICSKAIPITVSTGLHQCMYIKLKNDFNYYLQGIQSIETSNSI